MSAEKLLEKVLKRAAGKWDRNFRFYSIPQPFTRNPKERLFEITNDQVTIPVKVDPKAGLVKMEVAPDRWYDLTEKTLLRLAYFLSTNEAQMLVLGVRLKRIERRENCQEQASRLSESFADDDGANMPLFSYWTSSVCRVISRMKAAVSCFLRDCYADPLSPREG